VVPNVVAGFSPPCLFTPCQCSFYSRRNRFGGILCAHLLGGFGGCFSRETCVRTRVDTQLIERCVQDDQAAWKDLVSRYKRLVYSIAYTLCPDPEDASDVFQQVWLELYKQLPDLRDVESLPVWLITVTRRSALAVRRSHRPSEPLNGDPPDLSHRLAMIEKEHALEQAMGRLPERCRRLIDLLYFTAEEPSYAEIAKQMGMPVASIGPTRARCLEKLRKLMR
jgi:RNA polymerase sigma factor (sigma-70 family)